MNLNEVLKKELIISMGCTEPSAIAFAVAYAKEQFKDSDEIKEINLILSSNMLKNALCVSLPKTSLNGIEYIVLLALVKGNSNNKLTIFQDINENDIKSVLLLKENVNINIAYKENVDPLYIEVLMKGDVHFAKSIIIGCHDKIYECYYDNKLVYKNEERNLVSKESKDFNFDDIYNFIIKGMIDKTLLKQVKKYNLEICEYGSKKLVGLNIGSCIGKLNVYTEENKKIISKTVSGIDSRMSGISKKVIINSGSGNQGITATVPIVEYARLNRIDLSTELCALALSHLVAIYIRSKQSRLSSSCGAVCASAGVAAGIAYMLGCSKEAIEGAILNHLCSNFGIFCDGAKVTCSFKVASSISTAINSAYLAKENIFINNNYGVISSSLDDSLDILSRIEKEFTEKIDKTIMSEAIKNTI